MFGLVGWHKWLVALILVGLGGSLTWLILSLRGFDEGIDIRQQVMAGAFKTLWKHPLAGSGLGTLGEELIRNQQPLSRIWGDAHNLYLTLAAETGLIGPGKPWFSWSPIFSFFIWLRMRGAGSGAWS